MDLYAIATQQTLDKISSHCPRALSAYLLCVAKSDHLGHIIFTREEIMNDRSESYVKFKNNIKMLAREDVLEWHEMGETMHVQLAIGDDGLS